MPPQHPHRPPNHQRPAAAGAVVRRPVRGRGTRVAVGLLAGVLAAAAAVPVAWLSTAVRCRATTRLQIAQAAPPPSEASPRRGLAADRDSLTHQAALLCGESLLRAAAGRPEVSQLPCLRDQADPVAWLNDRLRVDLDGDSVILEVTPGGSDPEQAIRLVEAVAAAYGNELAARADQYSQHTAALQNRHERGLKALEQAKARLDALAASIRKAPPLPGQLDHAPGDLAQIRERIRHTTASLGQAQQELAGLEQQLAAARPEDDEVLVGHVAGMLLSADPWIAQADSHATALEAALYEQKLRAARPDLPTVLRLEDQVRQVKRELGQRRDELLPEVTQRARQQIARGDAHPSSTSRDRLLARVDGARRDKAVLEEELNILRQQEGRAAAAAETETLQENLKELTASASETGDELQRRQREAARQFEVTVVEEPTAVAVAEDAARRRRTAVLVGLAAFVVTFLGVVGFGLFWRRRR